MLRESWGARVLETEIEKCDVRLDEGRLPFEQVGAHAAARGQSTPELELGAHQTPDLGQHRRPIVTAETAKSLTVPLMSLLQVLKGRSCGVQSKQAWRLVYALLAMMLPISAAGQDKFEIQVYDSQTAPTLVPRVELHLNYDRSGTRQASDEGELPTDHVAHYTLEPQMGVADWCEVGGYFQTALRPEGAFDFAGVKLRFKARLVQPLWNLVRLALNTEISMVPGTYEANRWGSELRPIVDLRLGRFYASVNPILSIDFRGALAGRPQFQPATKASIDVLPGLALGAEYYAGLGPIDGFFPSAAQTHLLFGALDWSSPLVDLNLGVGYGLGAGERWVTKAIIGVQWDHPTDRNR